MDRGRIVSLLLRFDLAMLGTKVCKGLLLVVITAQKASVSTLDFSSCFQP